MLRYLLITPLILLWNLGKSQNSDSVKIRHIFSECLSHGECYSNLDFLSNKIGGRLAGSPQAAAAVEYSYQALRNLHPDTVYLQACMVPHWIRGEKEKAKVISSRLGEQEMTICALGGSVSTPESGLSAEVVEITDFEQLKKLGRKGLEGKIVFYNRIFDPTQISTFDGYGDVVEYRWSGASKAAEFGATGTICRSCTPDINNIPHTGGMGYDEKFEKIPCCAISSKDAERLSKLLKDEPRLKFWFRQTCKLLSEERSYNVIAEIKGNEHPEEIIVIGGHLDSWETGDGANDDGSGCVQSIEVLRLFKSTGIRPKRTIRAVLFMNEENGLRGGKKYAEEAHKKGEHHILAIESDRGSFSPRGFSCEMESVKKTRILAWKDLFLPYGVYDFSQTGGGSDIKPLHADGVPAMELVPDSQRYFDIHHTSADTFSNVSKRELEMGSATIAALAYLVSEYGL
jgi:carboxypeptidase Q